MFGKPAFGTTTSSAFGTGSSLFGTPAKPTVGFSNQQMTQSSSIFGQKPLFGSSTPSQQTSLFGSTQPVSSASSSLFGQSKPLFGSTTTQSSGFGTSSSLFSTPQSSTQSGGLFGGSFASTGTTLKFEPPTATDTMLRNGTNQTISTKHMCITAMKQYEGKSVEELRCEDYVANRKGPQTSGSLTFGQSNQPSTSGLFSTSTTSAQSSLFGQNKSLFGNASSGFGSTATSTPSLFGTQQSTGSSLFGPKKTGIFGSTTTSTVSPFGQTQQTGTGLFGAKPTTGFGSQQTSLFGGTSTFGAAASTSSPFSFGTTSTTSLPFGQAQPATSGFGFAQPAASTAPTSLFGAKPATSGFGAFGTTPATSAFGTQATTGGLFGAKSTTGGLFGSNTGSLFGNTATSSAPSLFGSTVAKPTTSLFGSTVGQTGFGAQTSSIASAASAAPIVLGADVNQTLLQNALIEAQIAASPYGDSPLLKLVPKEVSEKHGIPNPTSVERQMRFLASKKERGANTTTVNGPSALGSIPAAGLPISMPSSYNKNRNSTGDFTYRPVFSPPALKNRVISPIVNLNTSINKSSLLNGSERDDSVAALLEKSDSDLILQNKRSSNVKRLDLALLHKSMQENRNRSVQQLIPISPTTHFAGKDLPSDSVTTNPDSRQDVSVGDGVKNGSLQTQKSVTSSIQTPVRSDGDNVVADRRQISLHNDRTSSHLGTDSSVESLPNTNAGSEMQNGSLGSERFSPVDGTNFSTSSSIHPAGIKLTRPSYECEPSLSELAAMAERDGGVCHIEDGFTVRRLAYGSVFWPGPLDLSDIDIDEVVHFRQHEVTVYPDDDKKPPVGEGLNRFAEVSLERVWPVDKQTKEVITDPLRIERCGFRSKLERCCASMEAKFKDYRPETGTWVFTVPHFTKYGLLDESDEEMPSPEQLRLSKIDSRIQSAVQRARPPLGLKNHFGVGEVVGELSLETSSLKKSSQGLYDQQKSLGIPELPSPTCRKGLGGLCGNNTEAFHNSSILNFTQTTVGSFTAKTPTVKKGAHKATVHEKSYLDDSTCLDSILEGSLALETSGRETTMCRRIELQAIEPLSSLPYIEVEQSVVSRFFGNKTTLIDGGIFHSRRTRVGWAAGVIYAHSMLPTSFSIAVRQLQATGDKFAEYLGEMLNENIRLSSLCDANSKMNAFNVPSFVPRFEPSTEPSVMIDAFIEISEKYEMHEDSKVWKLCKALFTDESHINSKGDRLKKILQRERLGEWLREVIAYEHREDTLPSFGCSLIFYHLCNGNLHSAVKEAVASKRFLLGITLATFQNSPRAAYKKQIEYWSKNGAKEFIDESLLKIHLIMAGMSQIDIQGHRVYVTEGLDWIQAMGLYIWYYSTAENTMAEAVEAFELTLKEERGNNDAFQSVYYGLIKIACNNTYSMSILLDPTAFSSDCFDYHVSWHLFCLLDALGFKNFSKTAQHMLHIGYAEQLAHLNLISMAVFVLMHIRHDSGRHNAVSAMADRLADKGEDEQWRKLVDLNLPNEIFAHSKFLRAKINADPIEMCRYALEAGMFERAHTLLVEKVGPFAITNDRLDLLENFCMKFEEKSNFISNWGSHGQVYADFYRLHQAIRDVQDDAQVGDLIDLAHSIGPRLSCMETKSNLERLSVAVMSRLVYEILARFKKVRLANLPLSLDKAVGIASCSAYSAMDTDQD